MKRFAGERFALGVGLGTMIGVMTSQVAVWIAIGVALGIVLAAQARRNSAMHYRAMR